MTHPFQTQRLGDILVTKGIVTREMVDHSSAAGDGRLGERLMRAQRVTSSQLFEALAEQYGLPYAVLDGLTIPQALFQLLSASQAYRYGVAPLDLRGDVLRIAISDPTDVNLTERLERITGRRVDLVLSSAEAIQDLLKRSEGSSAILRDVSEDFRMVILRETEEGGESQIALDQGSDAEAPVVKLINSILLAALQKRASDIHFEAYDKSVTVKYRIDGVLYPATEVLDRRYHAALLSRLKVMAELDIAEKRVPQDGRFKLRLGRRDIDFRVSVLPAVYGEDAVIRILDRSCVTGDHRSLRLDALGIGGDVLKRLRRAVREPYGMVLITGPTGSGKTTTLYAALSETNTGEEKTITIEDPVEYQLDGIVQIPVNEKKGLTFARGLRSILRHDPDRIMVGEIRDPETAQIAVQSALTGHLVFTTVHANNAFDVIGRFTHMGLDVYNFVSALNCVMAQRLVRIICPRCKGPAEVSDEMLELSGLDPAVSCGQVWYEGRGCEHCSGTGYRGRYAITEFLDLSQSMRDAIVARQPLSALLAAARAEGMSSLRESALAKAMAGETTLKEINRVTFVD